MKEIPNTFHIIFPEVNGKVQVQLLNRKEQRTLWVTQVFPSIEAAQGFIDGQKEIKKAA